MSGGSGPGNVSMFISGLAVGLYGAGIGCALAVVGAIIWIPTAIWMHLRNSTLNVVPNASAIAEAGDTKSKPSSEKTDPY